MGSENTSAVIPLLTYTIAVTLSGSSPATNGGRIHPKATDTLVETPDSAPRAERLPRAEETLEAVPVRSKVSMTYREPSARDTVTECPANSIFLDREPVAEDTA